MKELNVMVVDDSAIMVMTLSKMVTDMGHTVVATAKTGSEAVKKYLIFKPDIITMDISMPNLNGIYAVKEIMQHNSDAIIIMITSQGQQQLVIESVTSGAKDYILKPITSERLQATIETVWDKYNMEA